MKKGTKFQMPVSRKAVSWSKATPFISTLSMAAFPLHRQEMSSDRLWPTELKIFTLRPFMKGTAGPVWKRVLPEFWPVSGPA